MVAHVDDCMLRKCFSSHQGHSILSLKSAAQNTEEQATFLAFSPLFPAAAGVQKKGGWEGEEETANPIL